MSYDSYEFLEVVVGDGVASVLMNRPEKRNASTSKGHREFAQIFADLARDDEVRAVRFGGRGPAFSAGHDREWGLALDSDVEQAIVVMTEEADWVQAALSFRKPLVSAIHGAAYGAAFSLALLCDIVIVERDVVIRDPHAMGGVVAGDGGAMYRPMYTGLLRAKAAMLTGAPLTADQAEGIGLVTEVVDPGASWARALEWAQRFADGPSLPLQLTKWTLNQWLRAGAIVSYDTALALQFASRTPESERRH